MPEAAAQHPPLHPYGTYPMPLPQEHHISQPGYPGHLQYPQGPYYMPYPQQPPPQSPAYSPPAAPVPAVAPTTWAVGATPAAPPQQAVASSVVAPRFMATTDLESVTYHTRPFVGNSESLGVLRHRMWVAKSVQDFDESAAVIASIGVPENWNEVVNIYHVDGAQMRSLPIKGVRCLDMHRGILALAANESLKIVDAQSGRVLRDGLQPNGITSEWGKVAILGSGNSAKAESFAAASVQRTELVMLLNIETGRITSKWNVESDGIKNAAALYSHPDVPNMLLAWTSHSLGVINLYDVRTGAPAVRKFVDVTGGRGNYITNVSIGNTHRSSASMCVLAGSQSELKLWDFGTGKSLWGISNDRERIAAPGATQSAIICIEENEVHVWDINALPREPTAVLTSKQRWGTEFTFGGGFEKHFFFGSWTGIGHIMFKQ